MKNMMRKSALVSAAVCIAFSLVSCGALTEKSGQEGAQETGADAGKDTDGIYTFQDAEGNSYEAELLEKVPKCRYDFSCLSTDEETGFKSYTDKENGVRAKQGIDVSEFQGEEIDWKQVRQSGIEFVFVRLGYRTYGESGDLVLDAMYDQNVRGALQEGLQVGVYFFSQATTAAEAVEEAEFVLAHLKSYEIDGPVVFDTEEIKWDTARTDGNTGQDFTNYCKVFCDTIQHAGYDTMIYANMKWMAFTLDLEELTEYNFWYADYHDVPQCPYDFKIWQYSETGAVPGINSNVDLNLWFQEEKEG